jgi:cobyric acid synthase
MSIVFKAFVGGLASIVLSAMRLAVLLGVVIMGICGAFALLTFVIDHKLSTLHAVILCLVWGFGLFSVQVAFTVLSTRLDRMRHNGSSRAFMKAGRGL